MYKAFLILFITLICLSQKVQAQQNLVPNPSFEEYDSCPSTQDQLDLFLQDWYQVIYSPDYYNSCSSQMNIGDQIPRSGNAYTGAFEFLDNGSIGKEYFQVKLKEKLSSGKRYCVTFYVSLSDSSMHAIKCMGALFTKQAVINVNFAEDGYTPQVAYNGTSWLDSKTDWMEIAGSFIASGGEEYLTLGCFESSLTLASKIMSFYSIFINGAYYYFDDVSVTLCDEDNSTNFQSGISIPNVFTPNGDMVNDHFIFQLPQGAKDVHFYIYNRWGNTVCEQRNTTTISWNGTSKDNRPCVTGTYFYLLKYEDKEGQHIQKNGFVQLLR